MESGPSEFATLVLSHSPARGHDEIEAYVAAHGPSPEADAVLAFARTMTCRFEDASSWEPTTDDALTRAVQGFVQAICLARAVTPVDVDELAAHAGWHSFAVVEAAMSSGAIAYAEQAARAVAPYLDDLAAGTFAAWNKVALSRSLAFQGRITEARAVIDEVLTDPRRDQWPAVDRIARGVCVFLAAHEGDPAPGEAYAAELLAELPDPRTYLECAVFVLAAFARQAAGAAAEADRLILHGGGGAYLPRYQIVDRIYCYEILVESALSADDVAGALAWVELAEVLPTDEHDMAGAALGRIRARIALALGDNEAVACESALAVRRAALAGGSLEVLRARLLAAVASRAGGEPVDVAGLEDIVRLATTTGARVVREWAVRELGARGRRLRNVPGLGWESLTDRQRLVAVLAAQGLRNREIADRLFLSERTVEGHVSAVLDALGSSSRVGIGRHLPGPVEQEPRSSGLTPRQYAVAELVAAGHSNAAIARELTISEKTVEKHLKDLFDRLGVQSRTAVAAAVRP